MKGTATYKDSSVRYVQWNGCNLDEVKQFVGERVFIATDGTEELYICNIGIVRKMQYIYAKIIATHIFRLQFIRGKYFLEL